jgi:hypothetical protein
LDVAGFSRIVQWQYDPESSADVGLALDQYCAAQLLHVLVAFISANAHTRSFRGLEWLEKAFAHELRAHAMSRVTDLYDRLPVLTLETDPHASICVCCIDGILNDVSYHTFDAICVAFGHYAFLQVQFRDRLLPCLGMLDAADRFGQIYSAGRIDRGGALA